MSNKEQGDNRLDSRQKRRRAPFKNAGTAPSLELVMTIFRRPSAATYALLALAVAALSFWKLKIVDPVQQPALFLKTIDLYTEHYPMAFYGFKQLASGTIPLWDPYQLCGIPFMAVPHSGLFYLGNLPYLFLHTATAIEVVYITHTIFGGWTLWLLTRSFGMSALAGLVGAVTFMWSPAMFSLLNQSAIHAQMSLLPVTILIIELTMRRVRWAYLGLIALMASQVFAGATETMIYNLYAGALYTIVRWAASIATDGLRQASTRALEVLGCVIAGIALSTPQLLPSLELVMAGARSEGLSLQEQRPFGPEPTVATALRLLSGASAALPFLLLGLGARIQRQRVLWVFALLVLLISGLLSGGGGLYAAYAGTPIGQLFRYPQKFLALYFFGLAMLAATGVNGLLSMAQLHARQFWVDRSWCLNATIAFGLIVFVLLNQAPQSHAIAILVLIGAFIVIPQRAARFGLVVVMLGLQTHSLSSTQRVTHERPFENPARFDENRELFGALRRKGPIDRVYLSPRLRLVPGLTTKQGMMSEVLTTSDYEALSTKRHGNFFDAAAGDSLNTKTVLDSTGLHDIKRRKFVGFHLLNDGSDLRLMNMASTRFFVVKKGDETEMLLRESSRRPRETGIRRIRGGSVPIYENRNRLPRAYAVAGVEAAAGEDAALQAIQRPSFDPLTTVVLEGGANRQIEPVASVVPLEAARIVEYEPERVVIEVEADRDGYLVLTDSYYPGWEARVNRQPTEVIRANYLFRAVPIEAGKSLVTFEFKPQSFRAGIYVASATGAGLTLIAFSRRRSAPIRARAG